MAEENGVWRTIRGRRVFIRSGEDLESAMKRSGKFGTKFSPEEVDKLREQGRKSMASEIDKINENRYATNNGSDYDDNTSAYADKALDYWNKQREDTIARGGDTSWEDDSIKRWEKEKENRLYGEKEKYQSETEPYAYTVKEGNPIENMANDRVQEKINQNALYEEALKRSDKEIQDAFGMSREDLEFKMWENNNYIDTANNNFDDLKSRTISEAEKEQYMKDNNLTMFTSRDEYNYMKEKEAEYKPEQRKLTSEDVKAMSNEELQDTYNKMLSNYYSDSKFYDHGTENMLEEIKNEMNSRPSDWREQVKANNEQLEKDLQAYKETHNMAYQSDGYYELFRENERRNAKIKQELPDEKYEPLEAYATYKEKRNKLEGLTKNSDGTTNWDNYKDAEWTGKEYTNDEFLENLEDENWHTERKMLIDAGLTNKQMEFVKDRTTFHNGSPSLDREITEELIKGAKGQPYRTPEQILSKRKVEEIKKVSSDIKTASEKGTGGMSTTYSDLKERYKALTGKDYDDSNISIPYNPKKEYKNRAGNTINQEMVRENLSGWGAEKVKSEIEREKDFLMNYSPEDREINNAYIKEMEKYYDSMEKYESRISDDYGTKEWEDGYGSRMGGSSWKGTKLGENLSTTEIAKAVTDKMKEAYPGVKIGRKTSYFSGGSSADFSIMESDKPLLRDISDFSDNEITKLYNSGYNSNWYKTEQEFKDNLSKELSSGHYSVNSYHVDDDYRLTPYGKQVIKDLSKVSNAYNFDDSDSMSDYFHTGFYSDISIGKYNKPYVVKDNKIEAQVERFKKRKGSKKNSNNSLDWTYDRNSI